MANRILVFYGSYRSDRMGIRLADFVVKGLAAGVAAGVIGTAGAIAAAPYADSYAYYSDEPGYW